MNALPQASTAVAVANTGASGHSIVDVAGSGAITGAVWSSILIVCEAVDELPHASVAVQVLVMLVEAPQVAVVTSLKVNVNALPQASTAVAVANTGASGHSIVDVAGSGAITGAVIS